MLNAQADICRLVYGLFRQSSDECGKGLSVSILATSKKCKDTQ